MSVVSMILPALVPAVADGLRGVFRKFTGGEPAEPRDVGERIKLIEAGTERLRAMAELDRPHGEISRWVADMRASFRYLLAGLIVLAALVAGAYVALVVPEQRAEVFAALSEMAGSAFGFIFGDRMYRGLRGAGK